jgi:tetratricopeptide (TPR) repeat protein
MSKKWNTNKNSTNTIPLGCSGGNPIITQACAYNASIQVNLYNYTTQEIIDEIENAQDEEAMELLNQARESIDENNIEKAIAEINTALIKTKLAADPNNSLIQTAYEQIKLALNFEDYKTASSLSENALEEIEKQSLEQEKNQTTQAMALAIFILIVISIVIIFISKKPKFPKSKKQQMLEELRNSAKSLRDFKRKVAALLPPN